MANSPAVAYILRHLPDVLWRDVIQELFTIPDRIMLEPSEHSSDLFITAYAAPFVGFLVSNGKTLQRVTQFTKADGDHRYKVSVEETDIVVTTTHPILSPSEPCLLSPGVVANYTGTEPLETKIGRVIINYLLFAEPFGSVIPFFNEPLQGKKIEEVISQEKLKDTITVEQVNHYATNLNFIESTPEFVAPNLTLKSLTTDPNVAIRKKELIEKFKDRLERGDVTAMAEIEAELIKMDKNWLAGDPSLRFMLQGKYFSNVRKKLFLTHGTVTDFGQDGSYTFVPNSLEEGWTQQSFPAIANEIRAASYARAKETAKGGEESKFLLRVFQNTRITEDDCGTQKGLAVDIAPHNASEYIFRNYVDGESYQTFSESDATTKLGTRMLFRSPMYCTTQGGYCKVCMGKMMAGIGQKVLATAAAEIGSTMTTLSLKKSHDMTVKVTELEDLDVYLF